MLIRRKTVTYEITDLIGDLNWVIKLNDISSAKIIIPGFVFPVDCGSWCYTKRKLNEGIKINAASTAYVDLKTFQPKRKGFVKGVIDYLILSVELGKAPLTIRTYVNEISRFIKWCDKNCPEKLNSGGKFEEAVEAFTENLIDLHRRNKISINTAAALQARIIQLGLHIFSNEQNAAMFSKVRKINYISEAINHTNSPDNQEAKFAIEIYFQLFNQLSDFVINFKSFPYRILVGNEYFTLFPISVPFVNPQNTGIKSHLKRNYSAYDFLNGRIKSIPELIKLKTYSTNNHAREAHRNANRHLKKANQDKFNSRRIDAATLGFQAFIMLFSANTGMNLAQIEKLVWSNKYETKKEKLFFKAVKNRAGGKVTTFQISSGFHSHFNRFLKLRSYLLEYVGVKQHPRLFFSVCDNNLNNIGMNFCTGFSRRLKRCFNIDLSITSRMWRSYKSDWLINATDIVTTSLHLQNEPNTVLKNYSNGNPTANAKQLSDFLDNYKSQIIKRTDKSLDIPVGQCVNQKPQLVHPELNEPDCTSFEGCFNCVNFKVHADVNDYHKLVSFKYILEDSQILAYNNEHYEKKVVPVLNRINNLLEQIKSFFQGDQAELEQVEINVRTNEVLSDYWAKKLDMLIEIGVLT